MFPDKGENRKDNWRRKRPWGKHDFSEPWQREELGEEYDGWFPPAALPPVQLNHHDVNEGDRLREDSKPHDYPEITIERAIHHHQQQQQQQWGTNEPSNLQMMMENTTSSAPSPHRRLPPELSSQQDLYPPDPPHQASYYHNDWDDLPRFATTADAYYTGFTGNASWGQQQARGPTDFEEAQLYPQEVHQYEYRGGTQPLHTLPLHLTSSAMEYGYHGPPMYFPFGATAAVPPAAPYPPVPYSLPPPGYSTGDTSSMDTSLDNKRRRAKTFPEKLMKAILENPDEDAIAWLPDGRSFVIVNQDLFTTEILDKAFKKAKYASFIRKLHRWGFVRLTSGTGTDCFYHRYFTLNDPDQASNINCTPPQERVAEGEDSRKPSLAGVERFIRAKLAAASNAAKQEAGLERAHPRDTAPRTINQPAPDDDLSSLSHGNDLLHEERDQKLPPSAHTTIKGPKLETNNSD